MKCRLSMKAENTDASVQLVGNPLGGSNVGKPPADDNVREEPQLGVGAFDEPPDWAQKPELIAPRPDLDETFAGRGQDVGGYQMGDVAEVHNHQANAVSDAYSIMTSGRAMEGSGEVVPRRKKSGKAKARGAPREKKQKNQPSVPTMPGGLIGLPPDLGNASFKVGMQEEDYRPQQGWQDRAGQQARDRAPHMAQKQAPFAPGAPVSPDPAAPVAPAAYTQPPAAYPGGQWPPPDQPVPPLGAPLRKQGAEPVRRPVPKQAQQVPAAAVPQKAPRARPSISMPSLDLARRAAEVMSARVIVGVIGGVIVLFAVIYMLVGGNYFSSDARALLESAQKASSKLGSVHLQAEILLQTEKAGTITEALSADLANDRDLKVAYGETSYRPALEYITAAGKTYKKAAAAGWAASTDASNPDFTSSALFDGASGSRLIDKQVIDGVECEHIAFESGPAFARSFFPGVEVSQATRVDVEIWVDPQKQIRHVRLDARNLETRKLGNFACHVEAALSGFGAPLEIKPPI